MHFTLRLLPVVKQVSVALANNDKGSETYTQSSCGFLFASSALKFGLGCAFRSKEWSCFLFDFVLIAVGSDEPIGFYGRIWLEERIGTGSNG